jgi:hypothetical protein
MSKGGIEITVGFPIKGRREMTITTAIGKGMEIGSKEALKIIKKLTPVFSRKLRRSIKFRYNRAQQKGTIGSKVKYLSIMEYGRRPGARMPPVSALIPWVKKRFKITGNKEARRAAWGVAINIKKHGIEVSARTGLKHDEHSPKRGAMFTRAAKKKEIKRGTVFNKGIKAEVARVRARVK